MASQGTRNKEQQEAQRLYEEMKALEDPKRFRAQYEIKKAQLEAYQKANKAKLDEPIGAEVKKAEPVKEVEPVLPVELDEPPVVKVSRKKKDKDEE